MESKSFKYWTRQAIKDQFGLETTSNCQYLENWLALETEKLDSWEREFLTNIQKKLKTKVDVWNEQEVIIKFIALLIYFVDYDTEDYQSFANRKLTGKIDEIEISGEVDLMIASGTYEPQSPYFCLHEYKKEQGQDKDSYGQLLIAMMTAEELNKTAHPIYGALVIGRNWFFLTLKDRKYCISDEFVATRDDIFSIYLILRRLKGIIDNMV